MRHLFRQVDDLLRGRFTSREELAAGRISLPLRTLLVATAILGAIYGVFMGLYSPLRIGLPGLAQLAATVVKVPLLFLITLAVTAPSLYVVSALADSRLRWADTLRLLLAATAVNLALLASFGPITGFFTLSTTSYHFMIVLNVFVFTVAGVGGLAFLARTLAAVLPSRPPPSALESPGPPPPPPSGPSPAEGGSDVVTRPLDVPPPRAQAGGEPSRPVFRIWIVIYAVVGAQMGWVLRPFIGTPTVPFSLFRERDSNFFEAVFRALGQLFS